MSVLQRIPEPAVSRQTLVFTAGVVWGGVGLFLCLRAYFWFAASPMSIWWMVILALGIGLIKGRLVFSRLAARNLARIKEMSPEKEKVCFFAFQAIRSWVLILGMITLGILLRMSPLTRELLAVIYLAIGSGLVSASTVYWGFGG
jgi:hypothetical protein